MNIIHESDRVNICALAADINIESKSVKTLVKMLTPCVENLVFNVVYISCLVYLIYLKTNHVQNYHSTPFLSIFSLKSVDSLKNMTLDHKTSHKQHRYICSNSQKYIVWVKIIDFSCAKNHLDIK